MKSTKIKIFIVDDHEVVRIGLSQFLEGQENLQVCGTAADANSAISLINSLSPDIVIIDISLKGVSGLDLIKAVRTRHQAMNILALSMHSENEIIRRALHGGARGYVLKSEPVEQVVDAINSIMNGKTYISDCLKEKLVDIMMDAPDDSATLLKTLTDREYDLLKLIGEGLDRKEISRIMNISTSTIGTYRDRIKKKLKIQNSSELMKFAVQAINDSKIR